MLNKSYFLKSDVYLNRGYHPIFSNRDNFEHKITQEEFTNKGTRSIKDQIFLFLTDYNLSCSTYYVKTNTCQCSSGRRRSVGDILGILRSYNEEVSEEEVMQALYDLATSQRIRTFICGDINKRVYCDNRGNSGAGDKIWHDEHNLLWDEYNIQGNTKV